MRTVSPNLDAFNAIRGSQSLARFADVIGIDRHTVYRVWNGATPSGRFIGQALTELPYDFDHLFVVVDEAEKN